MITLTQQDAQRNWNFNGGCRPGLRYGNAPENRQNKEPGSALDFLVRCGVERLSAIKTRRAASAEHDELIKKIVHIENHTLDELANEISGLAKNFTGESREIDYLLETLAYACVAAKRTLSINPHSGQQRAAIALLKGHFVEMQTGEGKTLAIALAAAVLAVSGIPIHVLTANDYLADRDANGMGVFFSCLGLSSACVLPDMDDETRRSAYACDIVYLTGKQAGFDWMRDALQSGPNSSHLTNRLGTLTKAFSEQQSELIQRGLCTAILDEADSLLLDEARTPLVLARSSTGSNSVIEEGVVALSLAKLLDKEHYQLDIKTRQATLTDAGKAKLSQLSESVPGVWRSGRYRDERVRQALQVLNFWKRDRDYVVQDRQLSLIDEQTGRTMPDRRLSHGLHVLLEIKEHCDPTQESETVASIAFQSFFLRYINLVGTSATLSEARGELARVYNASLVRVASQHRSKLIALPAQLFTTRARQYNALIADIYHALEQDRPVLIGTRSVEQSKGVSALLRAYGIEHKVLNASQDEDEASIVATAGRARRVTVCTNMAGRGTDISLGEGVAACGGLHVVCMALNDTRRVDRQLIGRTARQGDPGSYRYILALEDREFENIFSTNLLKLAKFLVSGASPPLLAISIVRSLSQLAQLRNDHVHGSQRRKALAATRKLVRHFALNGNSEHPV